MRRGTTRIARCTTLPAIAFAFALGACRGDRPITASDVVVQFYTMKEAAGISGAPTPKDLTALRPFISDSLARLLARADSLRTADMTRAPDEKPSFVEGDLFSSLFEGPSAFVVMPALDSTSPVRVPVEFTNDAQKPKVRWVDTAIVVQQGGKWLLHDIRYGGTWDFGNKGALLTQLAPTP
jgi:hypothetical protein